MHGSGPLFCFTGVFEGGPCSPVARSGAKYAELIRESLPQANASMGPHPNGARRIFPARARRPLVVGSMKSRKCQTKSSTVRDSKTAFVAPAVPCRANTIAPSVPYAFRVRRNEEQRNERNAAP